MDYSGRCRLLLLAVGLYSTSLLKAQLDLPKELQHPKFHVGEKRIMLDGDRDYTKEKVYNGKWTSKEPWQAFTDRDNVDYFKDSKFKTRVASLPTLGTMVAIEKEGDDGVLVSSNGSELGWIPKAHLIMWNHPLVRQNSAVDLKAFIVNTIDSALIRKINKDPSLKAIYQIYDGPNSKTIKDNQQIYQILFVYSYDRSSNRYLLSNNYKLTGNGQLLGWVDNNRVKIWDTALALEPNWEKKGMDERTVRSDFQAQVFETYRDAENHRKGDKVTSLLTRDPVALEDKEKYKDILHPSGRYNGAVPRFPFLNQSERDGIVNCGAIGKNNVANINVMEGTSDLEFGRLRKDLEKAEKGQNKLNIVFVVDATAGMQKHFAETIPLAVDRLSEQVKSEQKNNLKFGLVAYSDGPCGAPSATLAIRKVPLSNDFSDFKNRVKGVSVDLKNDGDLEAASRYGILTALTELGMQEYETNIIFHIGRAADVISIPSRSFTCEENPIIDEAIMADEFFLKRPAIVAVQAEWRNGPTAFKNFEQDSKDMMLDAANTINDQEKEKYLNYSKEKSIIPVAERRTGFTEIVNAPSLMRIYYPDRSQNEVKMAPVDVAKIISESFEACLKRSDEERKCLKSLFSDDQKLGNAFTEFSSVYSNALHKAGLEREQLELLASERVHMFKEAYTYMKHPEANYPSYRYVLFLKRSSVEALRDLFNGVENAKDAADLEERKDYLRNALEKYAKSILNIEDMTQKVDVGLLRSQITGVEDMIGDNNSILKQLVSLDDIDKMSDDAVERLFKDILKKGRDFNTEIYPRGGYPFIYTAGIGTAEKELEFFWIPMEYLF